MHWTVTRFTRKTLIYANTIIVSLGVTVPGLAADNLEQLKQLSLEALADLEVSIASKKPQKLTDTAAAVFVITGEDIRRSGATEIPELLRMVPGLHVARNDTDSWSVSSRGFTDIFSNKLLVLIDGRSVYAPLYSGVIWEAQDTLLEDIERIEVIRGPGASVWGANAVNGVINIITKPARDSQGGLTTTYGGNEQYGVGLRYGGTLGHNSHYRTYAKYRSRDDSITMDDSINSEDWETLQGGFRWDWTLTNANTVTLQGDIYENNSNASTEFFGGNLLARWLHTHTDGSRSVILTYYDRSAFESPVVDEIRDTWDVEFRHQLTPLGRHTLLWGLGYRLSQDNLSDDIFATKISDKNRTDRLFSAFFQDDIILAEQTHLTLGTKLEHNDYTGFEMQPSVRLRWYPKPNQTLWAAVSRAVRTPSRGEHNVVFRDTVASPSPATGNLPVAVELIGNNDYDSESLIAYEIGYRLQLNQRLNLDLAAFYNDYDDLRSFELVPGPPRPEPLPIGQFLAVSALLDNRLKGETYGVELAADWQVQNNWRLQFAYTFLDVQLHRDSSSDSNSERQIEGSSPEHQFSLRSRTNLTQNLELDLWGRYVDDLPAFNVDDYVTLDIRLAWRPRTNLTLALVGRNLLEQHHQEFTDSKIEREVYGRLEWLF